MLLTFKALNDQPKYLIDLLKYHKSVIKTNSYDKELLAIPAFNLVTYEDKSVAVYALAEWNKLPFDIRKANYLDSFKR